MNDPTVDLFEQSLALAIDQRHARRNIKTHIRMLAEVINLIEIAQREPLQNRAVFLAIFDKNGAIIMMPKSEDAALKVLGALPPGHTCRRLIDGGEVRPDRGVPARLTGNGKGGAA